MKKFLLLFISLLLTFCLAACAPGEPEGGAPDAPGGGKAVGLEELWKDLDGVWSLKDASGTICIISFSSDTEGPAYFSGHMFSDFMRGGRAVAVSEAKENIYALTIDYPRIEGNELFDEQPALTKTYTLDLTRRAENIIAIDDMFCDGTGEYAYCAATLEDAGEALLPAIEEADYSIDALWARFDGVWVHHADDRALNFIWFLVDDGKPCYSSGILFSGAMGGGEVIALNTISDGIVAFTVNYAAIPPSDMDDGRDAFIKTYTLDFSSGVEGELVIDDMFISASGKYQYAAPTLDEASAGFM